MYPFFDLRAWSQQLFEKYHTAKDQGASQAMLYATDEIKTDEDLDKVLSLSRCPWSVDSC